MVLVGSVRAGTRRPTWSSTGRRIATCSGHPRASRFNRRRRALTPAINDLRRRFLCGGPLVCGDGAEVTMGLGIIGLIGAIVVAVIILRFAGIL